MKTIKNLYLNSHVYTDKEINDDVIKFAAEVCAYYSDCDNSSKVEVDYTQRKNVIIKTQEILKHLFDLYHEKVWDEKDIINWCHKNPERYNAYQKAFKNICIFGSLHFYCNVCKSARQNLN